VVKSTIFVANSMYGLQQYYLDTEVFNA